MAETIDNETGEIVADIATPSNALATLTKTEIDIQIATAKQWPRSIAKAQKKITELATLDERTAEECCYALVRGRKKKNNRSGVEEQEGKAIEGPSIRLAEIAAQVYGNCRTESFVSFVNRKEMYVEAIGIFHDLESNYATRETVKRPIRTAGGYLYSEDMIIVTGRAAASIAKRNAILGGISRGVYWPAYDAARKVIAGDATTLAANRDKVYKAFASYAVTPAMIHDLLGIGGDPEMTTDHIALLRATFASIKNGEQTVEEVFAKEKGADRGDGVKDPLKEDKPGAAKTSTEPTGTSTKSAEVSKESPDQKSGDAESGATAGNGPASGEAKLPSAQASPDNSAPAKQEEAKPKKEPKTDLERSVAEAVKLYPDEPSYTAHIADICAKARSIDELKELYNTPVERELRRRDWCEEHTPKWQTMRDVRKKELEIAAR